MPSKIVRAYLAHLPKAVRDREDLGPSEKLFYAELESMRGDDGACHARNSVLEELLHVDQTTLSRMLRRLEARGLVEVDRPHGRPRTIYFPDLAPRFPGAARIAWNDEGEEVVKGYRTGGEDNSPRNPRRVIDASGGDVTGNSAGPRPHNAREARVGSAAGRAGVGINTNTQHNTPSLPLGTLPVSDPASILIHQWNVLAGEMGLPKVKGLSGARAGKVAARLKTYPVPTYWKRVFQKIRETPALRDRKATSWFDFDYLMRNDDKPQKVLDGWLDWMQTKPGAAQEPVKLDEREQGVARDLLAACSKINPALQEQGVSAFAGPAQYIVRWRRGLRVPMPLLLPELVSELCLFIRTEQSWRSGIRPADLVREGAVWRAFVSKLSTNSGQKLEA